VDSLIDVDTNWWNIPLINEVFSVEEASLICGMPICPRSQSNKLVWLGTNNGQFSVKSAYHLAKEISIMDKGMCSNSINLDRLWN
jgi:hypothetical protein